MILKDIIVRDTFLFIKRNYEIPENRLNYFTFLNYLAIYEEEKCLKIFYVKALLLKIKI